MSLAVIAAYPKSGHTWVRMMLGCYLEDQPVDLRQLGRMAAYGVTDLGPDLTTLKTHFLPGADRHRPYRESARKVLYIVRNPRDVLRSSERFLSIDEKYRVDFARHFVAHHGFDGWRTMGYGSWPESVSEWTFPERHFPNADAWFIRYEDIKSDTAGSLSRIIRFLGWDDPVDDDRVERAVRNAKLDGLRAREQQLNKPAQSKKSFFGQGLSGQSLSDYGADVEESYLRLLDEDSPFAHLAKRLGYSE